MVPGSQNPMPPLSAFAATGAIAIAPSVTAVASARFDRRPIMRTSPQITRNQYSLGAGEAAYSSLSWFWPAMSQNLPGRDLLVTPLDRLRVFLPDPRDSERTFCAISPARTHLLFPVKGTRLYGPQSKAA